MARLESRYASTADLLGPASLVFVVVSIIWCILGTSATTVTMFAASFLVVFFALRQRHNESDWLRHHANGVEAHNRQDLEQAEQHFRASVESARSLPPGDNRLGQALINVAAVRESLGDSDEAEALYREALEVYGRSWGPGPDRSPGIRASLRRIARAASRRLLGASSTRAQRVIEFAQDHSEVLQDLKRLAKLGDQLSFADGATSHHLRGPAMTLATSIAAACALDASDSAGGDVEWLLENATQLDFYARREEWESEGVRGAARGCESPLGKIFISWTIRTPRERAAIRGMKLALDYFNLEYFDYTKSREDDSSDASAAIAERLQNAVNTATCSLELMSSDFGDTEWVQHERRLLDAHPTLTRVMLCLEVGEATRGRSENEDRIVRVDASDGRPGTASTQGSEEWVRSGSNAQYYRSINYVRKALVVAKALRLSHAEGNLSSLRSHLDRISPDSPEFLAFDAWLVRQ